jgi:hypothetical protein
MTERIGVALRAIGIALLFGCALLIGRELWRWWLL